MATSILELSLICRGFLRLIILVRNIFPHREQAISMHRSGPFCDKNKMLKIGEIWITTLLDQNMLWIHLPKVPNWRIVGATIFSDQSSNSGEVRVLFTARTE